MASKYDGFWAPDLVSVAERFWDDADELRQIESALMPRTRRAAVALRDRIAVRIRELDSKRPPRSSPEVDVPRPMMDGLSLYPWQVRALSDWRQCGYRGVVEAVTGAGKTRLALAAIAETLANGGRAAVVVPSAALLSQWQKEITGVLQPLLRRHIRVGFLTEGHRSTLKTCDVIITTVQTGYRFKLESGPGSLVIADECHHYGADMWRHVLEEGFSRRLGITATFSCDDARREERLKAYFGGVCHRTGYMQALAENAIAPFKIAFVGVQFTPTEELEYSHWDKKARRKRTELIRIYGLPDAPFAEFMRAVTHLSKSGGDGARDAGLYLYAFGKRRAIAAAALGKMTVLQELTPAVLRAQRTIAFANTQEAAKRVSEVFAQNGVRSAVLTASMDIAERQGVFAAFEKGDQDLVSAPRLLDEGVDVPAADLALIVASSRSKRQMIQRMGRVIRKKEDGRLARIVILYVIGTAEDPAGGAHEDFVDEVRDTARTFETFGAGTPARRIVEYLNDFASH